MMQETSPGRGPLNRRKDEHRKRLTAQISRLDDKEEQALKICKCLRDFLSMLPKRTIATFAARCDEPLLSRLIPELPDHDWCLPRTSEDTLTFHRVKSFDHLVRGRFGIQEPTAESPSCWLNEIDIFLIPGVGFTRSGVRLGRGKGFYDRALAKAQRNALKIGVAFDSQIVESLPSDHHDCPMDFLATSSGVMPIQAPTA